MMGADLHNILRIENFYIEHAVHCMECGRLFIPALNAMGIKPPPILVNNYCGRRCCDRACSRGIPQQGGVGRYA